MRKKERHELIKQLVAIHAIRNQNELMDYLQKEGVTPTQATISRDIRDLQIVKTIDENGLPRFELFEEPKQNTEDEDIERLERMIEDVVVKVDRVQFMTVVHTIPDNANLFAAVLDDFSTPYIVATMASFDTLLVISRTEEDAQVVENFLKNPTTHSLS
ncbi:arginine repressor [Enterococcus florum]|uniref:Arginine repressor n=1 Tax=Enterococcus florum TaxID=2480627 RepID=A0A4P5P4K2_9ENTE|nr:ArgR family transcriptional regulator [Enterococcus florum]GCF92745.1 arginine repressor [Enterococcus florum]